MSQTLFEIGNQRRVDMQRVHDLLEELEGDVTNPEVAAAIDEMLTGTDEAMAMKVDGYCAIIREQEALAKTAKEEAARVTAIAKSREALASKLKERLKYFFEEHGITKLETPRAKLSIANNGGSRSLVYAEGFDPLTLPKSFLRCIPERWEPDAAEIRTELEAGGAFEGVELAPRGTRLTIK